MCIIVDINVASRILLRDDDPEFAALHKALVKGEGHRVVMVYGGDLTEEYRLNRAVVAMVVTLDQQGRARQMSETQMRVKTAEIKRQGQLRSDDPHIIALALVSGARILCSDDGDLRSDFRDKAVVSRPRGK